MSKKIVFKGNPDGVFQPFMPNEEQPSIQQTGVEAAENIAFDSLNEDEWIELCFRDPSYLNHPESYPLGDEGRKKCIIAAFFKKKGMRIGPRTASNLCKRELDSYVINPFNEEKAIPLQGITVTRDEINEILVPFEEEQKKVFCFLSSGKNQGILLDVMERLAHEFPLKSRNDLENLLAICQPGALMYWDDYRNNLPCRLAKAQDIARDTRGVLLYKEQQEQALQILSGCTQEESGTFRKQCSGTKIDCDSRDLLLRRIATHQNISPEGAVELYSRWHYYTASTMSKRTVQKEAFRIYCKTVNAVGKKKTE